MIPVGRLGASRRAILIAASIAALAVLGTATVGLAADPTTSPGTGGDPRSAGEGPGLVGQPLVAIGLVVAVGVVAVLATLAYLRLTDRRRS